MPLELTILLPRLIDRLTIMQKLGMRNHVLNSGKARSLPKQYRLLPLSLSASQRLKLSLYC